MKTIEELIEGSSLGTPEAKAIRALAPEEAVEKVMKRVAELQALRDRAVVGSRWEVKNENGRLVVAVHSIDLDADPSYNIMLSVEEADSFYAHAYRNLNARMLAVELPWFERKDVKQL